MARMSKAEFAKLCGMPSNKLAAYYSNIRKTRVVVGADGMIDTENPYNAAFLQKYMVVPGEEGAHAVIRERPAPAELPLGAIAAPKAEPTIVIDGVPVLKGEFGVTDDGRMCVKAQHANGELIIELEQVPDFKESERLLKYLDTVKRKREIQKAEIEISKKNGEVVATELVTPIIKRMNKATQTGYKISLENVLTEFAQRCELGPDDIAYMRAVHIREIHDGAKKALEIAENDLTMVVNEFAAKRGVGERA